MSHSSLLNPASLSAALGSLIFLAILGSGSLASLPLAVMVAYSCSGLLLLMGKSYSLPTRLHPLRNGASVMLA